MTDDAVAEAVRAERSRCLATLVRVLGDIELAEDALQEAVATALTTWPERGVPDNPAAWLTTVARNRGIDRIRRAARGRELVRQRAVLTTPDHDPPEEVGPVDDDQLRMLFTCCHPALSSDARVALTLRLLGGLTTAQVARAFLVTEPTMAQRLVRAKRKIRDAAIPYRVPRTDDLPARLHSVLAVVYLVHTTGADADPGDADGAVLRAEALRLARLLVALAPDEEEAVGLLALLLLAAARWPARHDDRGGLVLLSDQDRAVWDRDLIAEGHRLVRWCIRRDRPGPFQLQAAIAAVHCDAGDAEATDWGQVLALYDQLLATAPTPVVALNRAVALAEVHGPARALSVVDQLDLVDYQPFHAVRADLRRRVGDTDGASADYERAVALAPSSAVAAHLRRVLDGLSTGA